MLKNEQLASIRLFNGETTDDESGKVNLEDNVLSLLCIIAFNNVIFK